ncbi:retrovirus-related pol polyprotein from transposon TNT 1-94 [Tanacetum coccineum]
MACTPKQNDVVKRRNQTLVEAACTMLIFSKAPLFLWAEAAATACFTQNQSLIRKRHNKTPYKLLDNRKPDLSHLHIFGALCYPTNDSEDLVIALVPADSTGSPSSTLVDQETPSLNNNPSFGIPIPELNSKESSSRDVILTNVHSINQPPEHINQDNLNHVYKLNKALYGLKQALRAWYDYSLEKKAKTPYCNPVDTPMVEKSKLDVDLQGKDVDHTCYHGMIGSLKYLTASRPDLVFAVCMRDSCIALTAFADANHAGCQDTRRSTITPPFLHIAAEANLGFGNEQILKGASFTQRMISSISVGGSISSEGFLSSILLVVVIIVMVVIVVVILIVIVVAIVGVVIVVMIFEVVVVVDDVSLIFKLSFVIIAISGHILGAAGVQIPENNLDDLHSSREEDGTSKTLDPMID